MWILKYPSAALEIWISKWLTLAESIVGICTLCLVRPDWSMKWCIRNAKRSLKGRI